MDSVICVTLIAVHMRVCSCCCTHAAPSVSKLCASACSTLTGTHTMSVHLHGTYIQCNVDVCPWAMLHIFLLEHGHAAALLAIDAIPAAYYSDTVFSCPGQLGTSPAIFRVGCACRSTDTLQLLKDEDQTCNKQITDLRHPSSHRSRACMLCA